LENALMHAQHPGWITSGAHRGLYLGIDLVLFYSHDLFRTLQWGSDSKWYFLDIGDAAIHFR